MWEIWKERNRRIFCDSECNITSLYNKVEASITEVMNNYIRKITKEEGTFTEWDEEIKKNWINLINPPLVYNKKEINARKECKWELPQIGWSKLNFDGASRGNPGVPGIGCIISSDSGNWMVKRAKPIGITTNNIAKLEALHEGLILGLKMGIN